MILAFALFTEHYFYTNFRWLFSGAAINSHRVNQWRSYFEQIISISGSQSDNECRLAHAVEIAECDVCLGVRYSLHRKEL